MGTGFEETALAVFTTLAPMAAASFIVFAYVFATDAPAAEQTKRLDKMTLIPALIMIAGFIGAFCHLASPQNAFGVFSGVGSSPLSNEIAVAMLFAVVAVVYWIVALTGKLDANGGARKGWLWVLAALALVFAVFCGLAYMMETIPTWNTPLSIVQMVGYALAGGAAVGVMTLMAAHVELNEKVARMALILALCGTAIAFIGLAVQGAGLGDIRNIWGSADQLVPAFWGAVALFAVCGVVDAVLLFFAVRKNKPAFAVLACVVIAVGIFMGRIAFYGTYMSMAL